MKKSIVFFDIETTGLDVDKDQIIQFASIKISELGKHVFETKIKPTVPISEEAQKVHGITLESLQGKPVFNDVAESIYNMIVDCNIGGHNVVFFDMQMLCRQLFECGFKIDIQSIDFVDTKDLYRHMYPATLDGAYKHIVGKERRENTHDALVDIQDTVELWEAMQLVNPELISARKCAELTQKCNIVDLSGKIALNTNGEPVFTFGKNKGKSIKSDMNYVSWILRNPDFSPSFKAIVEKFSTRP